MQRLAATPPASLFLHNLAAATIGALISVAVIVLLDSAAADRSLFVAGSARPMPPAYLPSRWAEQVATKVLPSVVMLQMSDGHQSISGSGIVLTADGLIMTNNHVVAGIGDPLHGPVRGSVTFQDGRTAPVDLFAADPLSDVAVVRAKGLPG